MEVSYGKEPFDLRLMCLRLCRNLWKILAVTVVGTLLFGGGYYVKNVVLQPDPGYAASSNIKRTPMRRVRTTLTRLHGTP